VGYATGHFGKWYLTHGAGPSPSAYGVDDHRAVCTAKDAPMWDRARGSKRSIYEGGMRVPFIVSWPGYVPAGRIEDDAILCGASRPRGQRLPMSVSADHRLLHTARL
jgi:arylsulfatase A-like enzyme